MSDLDVVVSVQDGNYRMTEVARVTPPASAGPAQSVTVTFDRGVSPHRPTSIRVDYWQPRSTGHTAALNPAPPDEAAP